MNSPSGYTFIDDSQMSVCEKINKYFEKKTESASTVHESFESDSSTDDSFNQLDESFADLLNSNAHVTLLRKLKKEKETTMLQSLHNDESDIDLAGPNAIQTEAKSKWICDDSFEYDNDNWWDKVTDESFLEVERQCNAAYGDEQKLLSLGQNDTTLLFDVEEPTFLDETSNGRISMSLLSPMKQVAMRRPSTIIEESTIQSVNSSDASSASSASNSSSLITFEEVAPVASMIKPNVSSYRPSLLNVFPMRKPRGFYDDIETVAIADTSTVATSMKNDDDNKENSIQLMTFDDTFTEEASTSFQQDQSSTHSTSTESRDQFNDTLEAVDYYMEQGKKIMDKTLFMAAITTPNAIFSPKSRNDSLLKQTLARRHLRSISGDKLNMSFLK